MTIAIFALLISLVNLCLMILLIQKNMEYTKKIHDIFSRYVDEIKDILDDADHTQ